MNRGGQVISEIVESCRAHEITGLILVHEHHDQRDCLIVCHLPLGPIAYFGLLKVVTRHDIKDKKAISKMSEAYPHLMLGNFTTKGPSSLEGRFGGSLLSLLSPPPLPRDAMDRGRMHCKVWKSLRSSCPRGTARRSAIHRDDEEVELSTIKLMPCSSFTFLLGFASPGWCHKHCTRSSSMYNKFTKLSSVSSNGSEEAKYSHEGLQGLDLLYTRRRTERE